MNKPATSPNETYQHWLVKCLIYKALRDSGGKPAMEYQVGNGFIDVFDQKSGVAYEVEIDPSPNHAKEKYNQYTKNSKVEDVVIVPYAQLFKLAKTGKNEWQIDLSILIEEVKKYLWPA